MTRHPFHCVAGLLLAAVVITGCSDERPIDETPIYCSEGWQLADEACVLHNLAIAYRLKDADMYGSLLADDFRFYLDPNTAERKKLPVTWNRTEDSTWTALSLFRSDKVTDIRLSLSHPAHPDSTRISGAGRWVTHLAATADLEIDMKPDPTHAEGLTYAVTGQRQDFYFRQGRTLADTLATSKTSRIVFLIEWHDTGMLDGLQ